MLRLHGQLSRTAIADLIGYSPSKITSVVNELIDMGALQDSDKSVYTGGRRAKDLYFDPNFGCLVAAAVYPDKLDMALIDFDERVRSRRVMPIEKDSRPIDILNACSNFIQERLFQFDIPIEKVYAVGLTLPSPINQTTGTPHESAALLGWGGYQVETFLREQFPCAVIVLERDTNAMAFGELRKGVGRGHSHFVYVNLGQFIDVSIITNGEIYRGANGRAGWVSASASIDGLEISPDAEIALLPQLVTAALEGSTNAQQLIETYAQPVGALLARIVNLIDPEMLLIGGEGALLGHPLLAAIRRCILNSSQSLTTQNLRIDITPLGTEAVLTGITMMCAERVFIEKDKLR